VDQRERLAGGVLGLDRAGRRDNDGDVEILGRQPLFDHNGALLFTAPPGRQLVVLGVRRPRRRRRPGGRPRPRGVPPRRLALLPPAIADGYPQIANLDGDPQPEVLVTNNNGLALLEHDGTIKYQDQRPTGDPQGTTWLRPSTVHDFDGDGSRSSRPARPTTTRCTNPT
jgi:hypothetical protein